MQPLSERMRPKSIEEIVGQEALLGPNGALGRLLQRYRKDPSLVREQSAPSMIFWGPPGCGKTTLARLLAERFDAEFRPVSAVNSGVKELRHLLDEAQGLRNLGRRTLLFVDEIHRFNKSQQDALLPAVEEGLIILVGATTENPSFEVNRALLSRCHLFTLSAVSAEALGKILDRAEQLTGRRLDAGAREILIQQSGGDARELLNRFDFIVQSDDSPLISETSLKDSLAKFVLKHDRGGEEHYNLASALQKSIRNSNVDAALYYLVRLLDAGEPPGFVARRLIRTAAEDIGLADPQALVQAVAAQQAAEVLGHPECDVILAQCAAYLALAPKSNAVYRAVSRVRAEIAVTGQVAVPHHLRNAVMPAMAQLGYGRAYQYDHDFPGGVSPMETLPQDLQEQRFYQPSERAFERDLAKRLEYFRKLRKDNEGWRP